MMATRPPATDVRKRRVLSAGGLIGAALLLAASVWLITLGWQLRNWAWDISDEIRWNNIDNAWRWGSEVVDLDRPGAQGPIGLAALLQNCGRFYDRVEKDASLRRDPLDYPPLRLLVVSLWVNSTRSGHPQAGNYDADYAWPMLAMNSCCTLAAAVAAMLLVLHWRPGGWPAAGIAGLFIWFNPAVILESHVWPQWDIWPVPFYLLAILLASWKRWLAAGAVLAMGGLLKGQLLMVAPVLFLWPLFQGNFKGLARLACGFAAGAAVAISPWLLRGHTAWMIGLATVLAGTLAAMLLRGRWRMARYLPVFALPLGVGLGALLGEYSMSWYRVGILTGTSKYEIMARNCAGNLPALLVRHGAWTLHDPVFSIGEKTVEMKQLLAAAYACTLLLCGWGAARHAQRRDARALVALATPWVTMYCLVGQMDGRYLLYGACASVLAAASSLPLLFLSLLLTVMNFGSMLKFLLRQHQEVLPRTSGWLAPLEPAMAWVLLLVSGVMLYVSLTRRKEETVEGEDQQIVAAEIEHAICRG